MQSTDNMDMDRPEMNRPVLVPVDFSDCSRAALGYAARLSPDARTPLLILHVMHDSGSEPGYYRRRHGNNPLLPLTDIAAEMLEDWLYRVRREDLQIDEVLKTARVRLVSGLPGRRIVEVAEAEQAAMIVMGTHGRFGLSRLLRGSVTRYVMSHARMPVTTLREGVNTITESSPPTSTGFIEDAVPGSGERLQQP